MDGLMFDTERLSTKAWLNCGKILGIDLSIDFINSFKGRTPADSKKLFKARFGNDFDYDKARNIRTQYMIDYINENGVPVKKGLLELLNFLKESNIPCAVATSTNRELAVWYFEKAGVSKYLSACVFGDMVNKGKPEPDIFIKASEKIGVAYKDCVVFEDSPSGIKAGFSAGMRVIAVADMIPLSKEDLARVDYCVGSLDVAVGVVKNLLKN